VDVVVPQAEVVDVVEVVVVDRTQSRRTRRLKSTSLKLRMTLTSSTKRDRKLQGSG
jgi:hypothetical protein